MQKKSKVIMAAVPFLVVLLGFAFYEYGYLQVRAEMETLEEKEAAKQKTLEKYIAAIAKKPQLEAALAELKEKRKGEDAKVIEGKTSSIATASLQNTVKNIVTSRGGTISSERAEKPEDLGRFKIISVGLDAVFPDTRALCDALYSIETQLPYLVVQEIDSRIRNYRDPRDLTVRLKVSAITGGR